MCEHCEQNQQFQEKLINLVKEELLKARAQTPRYLTNARLYLISATSLNFLAHQQTQSLIRVTTIVVQTSSAGTLTIAERTWPINGFTVLPLEPDGLLVKPEDNITLTQGSAGLLSLELLGQEMADRGQRW